MTSDAEQVVQYVRAVVDAHPEIDVQTLLAQAAYVFATEGFNRTRRAAHVELFDRDPKPR